MRDFPLFIRYDMLQLHDCGIDIERLNFREALRIRVQNAQIQSPTLMVIHRMSFGHLWL